MDVVVPALLLPIPLLSLLLALYNTLFHRSTPLKRALFVFLAVLAAVASGSALSVACGEPLRVVAKAFTVLLQSTLSAISIYALSPSSQAFTINPPFLRYFLSLAALFVGCEVVSALIPTSPLLLSATLALVSRGILLTLAIVTAIFLHCRRADIAADLNVEKDQLADDASGKTPGRVSSPTQATWPFPGSLALQSQSDRAVCLPNKSIFPNLSFPLVPTRTHYAAEDVYHADRQNSTLLPLALVIAQSFATIAAALSIAASILVDAATNQPLPHILIIGSACMLLWSCTTLAIVQILPTGPCPHSPEKQVATGYEQGLRNDPGKFSATSRTPKPCLSRRGSDSLLDFLSLRDPFASSPPPPPPLPPVGLGLDEVDVGWSGNKEIGMQYRFPAPRSVIKGGRRKGKDSRANGKKRLAHQDSSRTLLPVPETRGAETDAERDKGFGDEARLAQLLLQSLSEASEDCESPNTSIPTPAVQSPQAAHVQQTSRWSTSTTVRSVLSTSISNRSGVSTYTTCGSERVPPSRISMNTIASVLGSRKSSEAKRKSVMTASSSKG